MRFKISRSSHPEVFFEKGFWKYAANLQENTHAEVRFALQHGCSPVNLLHIFRTLFSTNTSGRLLRNFCMEKSFCNFFSTTNTTDFIKPIWKALKKFYQVLLWYKLPNSTSMTVWLYKCVVSNSRHLWGNIYWRIFTHEHSYSF